MPAHGLWAIVRQLPVLSFLTPPKRCGLWLWTLRGSVGVVTALPGIPLMPEIDYGLLNDKLKAWDVLSHAQGVAAAALQAYQPAEIAEGAGIQAIDNASYDASSPDWPYHGVKIIPRETWYQVGSSNETMLEPGMVVDVHLGINHVDGKFGVSLQDAYLILETGEAELLTEHPASGAYDP